MSLTLLPAVDVRDGKAVRLRQGESGSETDYGSPLEAARTWVESGAEWIHLVDLDAAFGTGNNRDQLRAIVKELGDKVNIEMSGGVRDDASLDAALEAGAARVNIGTAALENPDWTASVIKKYGDRVAVGLDVRGHTLAARGWVKWRPAPTRRSPHPVASPSSTTCATSRSSPNWAWTPRFSANRCTRAPSRWRKPSKSHADMSRHGMC